MIDRGTEFADDQPLAEAGYTVAHAAENCLRGWKQQQSHQRGRGSDSSLASFAHLVGRRNAFAALCGGDAM